MAQPTFCWESVLPYPSSEVFAWYERRGAFDRFNPPWRPVEIVKAPDSLRDGSTVAIKVPVIGPLGIRWNLIHKEYKQGSQFCDEQTNGPFRQWRHLHRFIDEGSSSCRMRDEVYFTLPRGVGFLSSLFMAELRRLFAFRHMVLAHDLALHNRWKSAPRKRILISGSSGFIGSALRDFLSTGGHTVTTLVRRAPTGSHERRWDPERGEIDPKVFDDIDVVIHLGGENLLARRWTPEFKETIRRSRVESSRLLSRAIANLQRKPETVIMASAIGFYGDTGTTAVNENSPRGRDFLADTCEAWETAATNELLSSTRLVHLRIGSVLNARGGALKKMLPIFSMGGGGVIGNGSQYMSWIALQDILGIVEHIIYTPSLEGPINVVSPNPVTNREFTETFGRILHRPTLLPVPAPLARLAFGEVADAILLGSARVLPDKLLASGYSFAFPNLPEALRFECGRSDN